MHECIIRLLVGDLVYVPSRGARSQAAEWQTIDAHGGLMHTVDQRLDIQP